MRVVCDSCGASYKIPDSKLTKEVNKATCRKCGHAIFIRRAGEEDPKPVSAAPAPQNEERTLITSAADLERQARARAAGGIDESVDQRPTTVSLESGHGEATVPREPAPPAAFAPAATFPPPAAPFAPAPAPVPPPPAPVAPAPVAAPPAPPPPAVTRSAPPRPAPAISPAAEAPAPAPAPAAAAAAAHDPRGDLTMALVGLVIAGLGVLVLAVAGAVQSPMVAGLGAFLAFLGLFVGGLILLTGRFGTKPASLAISVLAGGVFSVVAGAATGPGAFFALGAVGGDPETPQVAAAPPAPTPAPPVEPPPAAPAVADAAPPVEAPPVEAPAAAPPPAAPAAATPAPAAPAPAPATKPTTTASSKPAESDAPVRIQPSSTASSSSSSTKSSSTASSSGSSSSTKPASTSSSSSSKSSSSSSSGSSSGSAAVATGVSPAVIDTMIKSNKGVKGCFVTQRNETGELPRGVKVKLTIQPSGKVSSAGIPSGEWADTTFDDCLSGAVKSIQFPPFEGDPVSVTYPFSI